MGLHHSAFPVCLDTSAFDGCEWAKTIINAPKATIPSEQTDRLPHGLDAAAPKSPLLTGPSSVDSNTPRARINWASVQPNGRCQNRSIQSEEGRGQARESRRKCSTSTCVCLVLPAGTQPASDKGMAFLHILPSSGCHSSPVIGYPKGRSCFVHNDFLSPSLNYAACQLVRYLTEEHKKVYTFLNRWARDKQMHECGSCKRHKEAFFFLPLQR